jgi:seryl-tRNA synthetase
VIGAAWKFVFTACCEDSRPYAGAQPGETIKSTDKQPTLEDTLMAHNDLAAQFGKISTAAKEADEKIRAAGQGARKKIEEDAARARDKASQAADHLKDRAEASHDKASKHWQDVTNKWHAHVAKMRNNLKNQKAKHEAKEMKVYAEITEGYALDAIDFAEAAVYEAEYAVLDALSARIAAEAMA